MQPGPPTTPLYNMSEDCLNLNVVRPKGVSEDAKLPVMVWIYGGAFFAGSIPTFNASELVQKERQYWSTDHLRCYELSYRSIRFHWWFGDRG